MHRNKLKKTMCGILTIVGAVILIVTGSANLAKADRLQQVKDADVLHCGVVPAAPGYAFPDKDGNMVGFDVDLCHAIAAAVLGDENKIKTTKMKLPVAFNAMKAGTVDVVTHRFTWTFSRDVGQGLDFTRVMVYDGQGFMVRKSLGIKTIKELDGATFCLAVGTTPQANVADYFRTHGMTFKQVTFGSMGEAQRAYDSGRCDAFSSDKYGLGGRRTSMTNPDEHMILSETISNEPISPMIGQGDQNWRDVVVWVLNALIAAEEYGITSKNVDDMRKNSQNPFVQRILGVTGNFGAKMGVSDDWAYNAIKAVGNYGEIWDKHLGKDGLGLDRGRNELYTNGGLMISPPFR